MSTVLLGVPDAAVESATTWVINKIGGSPENAYKSPKEDVYSIDLKPLQDLMVQLPTPTCERCQTVMLHVMQICCPLELSPFHRVLHIFACVAKSCWNKPHGWRVYRSQLRDSNSVSPAVVSSSKEKVTMETSDWCDEADDWGCDDSQDLVAMVADNKSDSKIENDVSPCDDPQMKVHSDTDNSASAEGSDLESNVVSQLEELDMTEESSEIVEEDGSLRPDKDTLENALSYLASNSSQSEETHPAEHVPPSEAGSPDSFRSFYLDVFDEPTIEMSDAHHVKTLLKEYERRERVDISSLVDWDRPTSGGKKGSGEKYEKTELKHGDKYFHKFIKRLKICPEQVVRYHYGGNPLPISRPRGDLTPSPCSMCRAPRVFELQLVPPLIPYLHHSQASGPAVEFGTVIVFTCSQSCWEEDSPIPREEFVIVQSDPDQHLFKV